MASPRAAPSLRRRLFPRIPRALALLLTGVLPAVSRAQSADPLADPAAGALVLRTFKTREYPGSPVVIRLLKHPATGEFLLLAGTTRHVFDGAPWSAGPTDNPAVRCLAVDGAGRIWTGGGDPFGFAERATTGQWRSHPLADRRPEPPRRPTGHDGPRRHLSRIT